MSTIKCVACDVNRHTFPSVPILEITKFATVAPATKFTFDAVGCGDPHGNTVTYPAAPGSVTVTFNTAADASNGVPARPATVNSNTVPAACTPPPANRP